MFRFTRVLFLALVLPGAAVGQPVAPPMETEVAAWEAYCDRLKETGAGILRQYPQPLAIDREEALSYLAQQVAHGVREVLLEEDVSFPLLRVGSTTIDSWGLDGADAKYLNARITGDGVYRLHGRLGNATLIAMQSFRMVPDYRPFASMSGDDWATGPNGEVDIRIAATRPKGWAGVWLETDPSATHLIVREYFGDWQAEGPSELFLERLDVPAEPPSPHFEGRLDRMADAFALRAPMWLRMSAGIRARRVNQFATPQDSTSQGLKDNIYGNAWFRISKGEALLIELDAPEARLWSFQLGNFWWESSDYVNRTGSLNGHQAVRSSDGQYRLVIALEDPGVPNWLDPAGHPEGVVLYRYQQTKTTPKPDTRLVRISELRTLLPADTPRVTPEQRRAEVAARRAHAARRWAP